MDFFAELEETKPRPWLVDDYDLLAKDLPQTPPSKWSKAVVFVDNAGSDFILGVMPLARELALFGTRIVLAANELPSLNDITVNETVAVVQKLCAVDADLSALVEAGMFEVVSSGNDIPLIDLSNVSDELNEAAADAELVIIEGMGRAVESNFDASFTVDAMKLALLKDPVVAARVGGEVYDCVCRYEPRPAL
jgi:type II pantothenate kinase